MCDSIVMPDGEEYYSISEDGVCLCGNTQEEILTWIISRLPQIEYDNTVEILRTAFGWEVSIGD